MPLEPFAGAMADHYGLPAGYLVVAVFLAVVIGPLLLLWARALRQEPVRSPAAKPLPSAAQ